MVERVAIAARGWAFRVLLMPSALILGWLFPAMGSAALRPGFNVLPGLLASVPDGAVAAPLPGGDVLIAGGSEYDAPSFSYLASAEVFDPGTETFGLLPESMTTDRDAGIAAPLPGGDVLIAGGTNGTGSLASAELFDPSTGTFSALPDSMTTPRWGAMAAPLPGGDVLIAGGMSCCAAEATDSAELFDPATGAFTSLPTSMINRRFVAAAAPLPDGDVLIAGGTDTLDSGHSSNQPMSSAELFDPSTDAFTATGSMTVGRIAPVAAPLPDGDVLIAGGSAAGHALSSAEIFDTATGVFTRLPASMTAARSGAIAAPLPGGDVLIAGGGSATAEVFDPAPLAVIKGGRFGARRVGRAAPAKTLRITNAGVNALNITGAAVSGRDRGDFRIVSDACAGQSLALTQTCTLSVRARPAAAGLNSATLRLRDNETNPGKVTLTVSGLKRRQ